MWKLEKIAKVLQYRMLNSEEGLDNKTSILFFGMDTYQKKDLHSEAKKAGFNPVYSMNHLSIKFVMQKLSLRKIETDKFKTTTIGIEHFWDLFRNLL